MPKGKKEKKKPENNMLRHLAIKKKEVVENKEEKKVEEEVRTLTTDEKENMKTLILQLEDHERTQLYHFIRMDDVKHTVKQNGILLNLKNTTEEFTYKIYKYINQCIDNKKYRQ